MTYFSGCKITVYMLGVCFICCSPYAGTETWRNGICC